MDGVFYRNKHENGVIEVNISTTNEGLQSIIDMSSFLLQFGGFCAPE